MPINILMPALSPTMEKGNLARWLKKEGDPVRSGDIIAEIETDKATMEVEAADEGVLARIVVPDGTADVPVNEVIGLIAGEGEDPKSVGAPARGGGGSAPPAQPQGQSASQSVPPENKAPGPGPAGSLSYARVDEAPAGAKPAAPPPGGAPQAPAPQAAPAPKPNGAAAPGGRVFASPLARRIAKEAGLDLTALKGSGPHGRIIERDVRAALERGVGEAAPTAPAPTAPAAPQAAPPPAPKAPAAAVAPGASADAVKALFEPGSYTEVPLDGMRKTIARRLTESKQTIPHFYMTVDVELDALLALREQINAGAPKDKDGKPSFKLSVNDFVIKALALALQRVPDANAVWAEDRILKLKSSDVGVAVAVEGGLFTPVIRNADAKTLSAISNEMKDLAARARARKLKPQEYQGGSTAISNLGMYGIKDFQAVINPPHGSILAVGAGEQRVIAKNGAPAIVQTMSVTLSVDHRVIDGALGAEVLAAFKGLIERPMGLLV